MRWKIKSQLLALDAMYRRRLMAVVREWAVLRPVFRHSATLARSLQIIWHGHRMFGWLQGRQTMTYAHLNQFALSMVGALIASTLFVTAAVGPVSQFI